VTISDEPQRVAHITSGLFGDQSGWSHDVSEGSTITLTGGADRRDDCAWFSISGPMDVVFGSDYVRGPKFMLYELGLLSNYDIGWYLAGANLSDIAAMGATPAGFLSVVRYPLDLPDSEFTEILTGIRDCCRTYGVLNVGGDIGSAERIILSGSAFGVIRPGSVLTRDGAKPGDLLVVSGPTGLAAAAMAYFGRDALSSAAGLDATSSDKLLSVWRRVRPEVALGRRLSEDGLATSCQDTSDGLRATIEQLATASQVGFAVDQSRIPTHPAVESAANLLGIPVLDLVFGGSVDFRLLFTVRADDPALPSLWEDFPGCTVIGRATESREIRIHDGGESTELPGEPWRHHTD